MGDTSLLLIIDGVGAFSKPLLDLKDAVAELERETDKQRDYQPGSDGIVRNLIDPILHPLVYGRSRILPPGITTRMAMEEDEAAFLRYVGEGETIPTPPAGEAHLEDDEWSYNMNGFPDMLSEADSESSFAQTFPTPYSRKFQLLPCQVDWEPETLEPHINSYINNFHPTKHKRLYKILTDTFFTVSPLWEKSLGSRQLRHKDRIPYNIVKYPVFKASELANEDENFDPEELICDPDGPCEQPEPGDFKPREGNPKLELNFQQLFPSLQVIFKMTNVELTPEKPKYEGVDWHIEGQLVSLSLFSRKKKS